MASKLAAVHICVMVRETKLTAELSRTNVTKLSCWQSVTLDTQEMKYKKEEC